MTDQELYEIMYDEIVDLKKEIKHNEDLINQQKAEIERAEADALKMRRKALLEAASKFAGHSDYHGDTILCKLICMAEGKEVKNARPLDTSEIKAEAIKEFVESGKDKLDFCGVLCNFAEELINKAKSEVVKEFAERLHKGIDDFRDKREMVMLPYTEAALLIIEKKIDNIVKEMVGDNNGNTQNET